jgi:uncharacterized cupredoxin-like copper-binding protein
MSKPATDRTVPVPQGGLVRGPVGRGVLLGAVAGALALLTAACGSSGSTNAGSPPPATGATATATSQAVPAGTQVTASLTEFHIALSQQSFAPGTYTFVVSNDGHATHALDITGPGLSNADTSDLSPGQKTNLTVKLQAGSYDFFCPVGNHKALGMNMDVTVNVGGSGGGANPTTAGGGAAIGGGGSGY